MEAAGTSLLLKSGEAVFGGLAARDQARAEQQRASINADIGRTRAIQTDTSARQGLESELASLRNVLASNEQAPSVGSLEVINELREVRGRERRIEVGNRNSEAADYRMQSRNADTRGRNALAGGFIKAGPSLFDLYEFMT